MCRIANTMTQLEGWLYMSHTPCAASSAGKSALSSLRFPLFTRIARLSLPFHFKNTQIIVAYTLHLVRREELAHCSTALCSDMRTPGTGTWGYGDMGTWGHEDMGTRCAVQPANGSGADRDRKWPRFNSAIAAMVPRPLKIMHLCKDHCTHCNSSTVSMGQGLWRCEHSTQLLMSQVRALAAAQDIIASSWPLKPSWFKPGSQNPQAGQGKRKADKAKWYLQLMSYIYPSFFSSSFWKSHLWGFILCSASALCATLPPLLCTTVSPSRRELWIQEIHELPESYSS